MGLGAGTLATYARKGEEWTFYELDPAVLRIALNSKFFTYLQESPAGPALKVITGDARLRLKEAPDDFYSLLVMDAFSSDSVPAHLMSREAMELYWKKLRRDGLLAFHISNRYFNYSPILALLAESVGATAWIRRDLSLSEEQLKSGGISQSVWVLMSREPIQPDLTSTDPKWKLLQSSGGRIWTDDYFNLLTLF